MTDALNSRVARFETNEKNVDSWVKGDDSTAIDFGGPATVRTPAKLIRDLAAYIMGIATQTVSDYPGLRAYTGTANTIKVTGYLATKKPAGIAGSFTRDSSDTTSADNGGTIIVSTDGTRWKRTYSGDVNVQWFGADATGTVDSTPAFQAALVWQAVTFAPIFMPSGTYILNGQLTYTVPLKLKGEGLDKTTLKCQFAGGATLVASGTNAHMPGTLVERFLASGLGPTGNGEVFYQSQTFESNRNGVFRDLQLANFDRAGLVITDSYDCFFTNLRLWAMGDGRTHGHGILLDRATWPVNNSYASTGNHYEDISCMNSYRGIGVTSGNQICYSDFKHITGEICDASIQTHLGTPPTNGWIGQNAFMRVYSESNISAGIITSKGTEIECRAATYVGGGANLSNYASNFVRFNGGVMYVGAGGTDSPTIQFQDGNMNNLCSILYRPTLFQLQFRSQNNNQMFLLNDGPAAGAASYAQFSCPENVGTAKVFFGLSTGSFIDYGISQPNSFSFVGGASSGKTWFRTGISLQANRFIGSATLVAGVASINTTGITANSKVFITISTPGGTPGFLYAAPADFVVGTSFKIRSTSVADTSVVSWVILDAQ
jgi:hypothetical protein